MAEGNQRFDFASIRVGTQTLRAHRNGECTPSRLALCPGASGFRAGYLSIHPCDSLKLLRDSDSNRIFSLTTGSANLRRKARGPGLTSAVGKTGPPSKRNTAADRGFVTMDSGNANAADERGTFSTALRRTSRIKSCAHANLSLGGKSGCRRAAKLFTAFVGAGESDALAFDYGAFKPHLIYSSRRAVR